MPHLKAVASSNLPTPAIYVDFVANLTFTSIHVERHGSSTVGRNVAPAAVVYSSRYLTANCGTRKLSVLVAGKSKMLLFAVSNATIFQKVD